MPRNWGDGWPNVWLGVSVESQEFTNRVEVLAKIPCRTKFVSCEPLLGPLDLRESLYVGGPIGYPTLLDTLDWVIAGGESGPDARPCELDCLRKLRDDCEFHGVPYFLKQLGGHPDARAHEQAVLDGCTHTEFPV